MSNFLDTYKIYATEQVLCKNGVIKPITKVRYTKPCIECGGDMTLLNNEKGGVFKSPFAKWNCPDKNCGFSEVEETKIEKIRRINSI